MANVEQDTRVAIERANSKFDEYYKLQKIVPEGEWEIFSKTIRSDLPITFRIVSNTAHTDVLRTKADEMCQKFPDIVQTISWYPGGLAYQLNVSRAQLRSEPSLKEFHQLIVLQAEAGTLFRQEAVSMIPVSFLDVQPEHRVMDMCAAPGSKTSQILEAMHSLWAEKRNPETDAAYPPGVCVANDFSPKRAHMLIHHVQALNSPCLLVTTRSAQLTPSMFYSDAKIGQNRVQFDRILADVPCSGDGTLRKAPALWPKWAEGIGAGLHRLQLQIAKRGAHLLRVGGRMVYSTCSLNPLENEAVVWSLLKEAKGGLKIVKVGSDEVLKGLDRLEGLTQWKSGWAGQYFETYEEVPNKMKKKIQPTFFCPTAEEYERENIDLKNCMRFLPHIANTGGFFVTVIEKVAELPWEVPLTQQNKNKKKAEEGAAEEEDCGNKRKREEGEEETSIAEEECGAKKTKVDVEELVDDEEAAEVAEVEQLAAEEADVVEQNKQTLSKQELLELEEDSAMQIFRKRTRCVDFEVFHNIEDVAIAKRLWRATAVPLLKQGAHNSDEQEDSAIELSDELKLSPELAACLVVRTSAAEARHRQMELRKELAKRERAKRLGHSKKDAPSATTEEPSPSIEETVTPNPPASEGTAAAQFSEGRGVPQVPRRVWLVSHEASRILNSKGRAPYKVLHAGVAMWEKNRAPPSSATATAVTTAETVDETVGVVAGDNNNEGELGVWNTYRPSMACARLFLTTQINKLVKSLPENFESLKESNVKKELVLKSGLSPDLFCVVPPALFVKCLATNATPPRLNSDKECDEEEKKYFVGLARERCSVLVTVVNNEAGGVITVPMWVGRNGNNLEVLVDMTTKKSLEFFVIHEQEKQAAAAAAAAAAAQ